jgi:hypothetical protein
MFQKVHKEQDGIVFWILPFQAIHFLVDLLEIVSPHEGPHDTVVANDIVQPGGDIPQVLCHKGITCEKEIKTVFFYFNLVWHYDTFRESVYQSPALTLYHVYVGGRG